MSTRSKTDTKTFIGTYRVLSAASGREVCKLETLASVLGVTHCAVRVRLENLDLARNTAGICNKGIKRAKSKLGYGPWTKNADRHGISVRPTSSTQLQILQMIRAVEASSGRRASLAAMAKAAGCSRQNVNQIEKTLFREGSRQWRVKVELEKRTNAKSVRAATLVKKGKKLTAAKFEEKLKRAIRAETRKRILTELAQGAKKSVLAEKYNMSPSGVGYITNGS